MVMVIHTLLVESGAWVVSSLPVILDRNRGKKEGKLEEYGVKYAPYDQNNPDPEYLFCFFLKATK